MLTRLETAVQGWSKGAIWLVVGLASWALLSGVIFSIWVFARWALS